MVEILSAVYQRVDAELVRLDHADRDRVIVSKGHSACALYATLNEFGILPPGMMETYHLEDSLLTGHVNHEVFGVEHSTGALGHGPSVALGMAIGLNARGSRARVYCIVGDGEIQEGSVWEALMLWAHLGLTNLTILIDKNGISSIRGTDDVLNMSPLDDRTSGFGLNTIVVDGHSLTEISQALRVSETTPTVIICETVKGKGVSFAENEPIWHYRTLNDELLQTALAHLQGDEA